MSDTFGSTPSANAAENGGGGDTTGSTPSANAAEHVSDTGNTVGTIINFFRSKGLNDFAIAGILGNWKVESGFSTTSFNSGEGAHGLANWEGSRWPALQNFANAHGGSPFDLNVQLEFTWHELTTGYTGVLDQLRNTHSAWDAAEIWNRQYEGSADYTSTRNQYAQSFLSSGFKNVSGVTVRSTGGPGGSYGNDVAAASGSGNRPLTRADFQNVAGLGDLFNSIPALRRLVDEAQANGWDLNRFQNAVENSPWWRTHSDSARQSLIQRANDPAAWQQSVDNLMGTIAHLSNQLGLTSNAEEHRDIAVNALMTGNSSNTDWLTNQLADGTNYKNVHSVAGFGGTMAATIQQLQQAASDYGFNNWNPQDLAINARNIVAGRQTMDTYTQQLRNYAKSAFPSFSKEIDAGQTMAQIAQPYISTASQMLERDPSTFQVRSPLIMKGLQGNAVKPGEPPSQMPLWQFENTIRQDPRWDMTNNAKSEASSLLVGLGQAWGFHV